MKENKKKTLFQEFMHYAMLNMIGMVGLSCYILADTFFVAQGAGSDGLTALNLAIPVFNLIFGFGMMLGIGGATKYTIFKSQKGNTAAVQLFMNSILAAGVLAVCFILAGIFGSEQIAGWLGADDTIRGMTSQYLRVILLFSPAFLMNNILNCFVRNDGDPQLSMVAMTIGSLSNVVLDYIFIFPLGLGIYGAALATGASPVISILILSLHFRKPDNGLKFKLTSLKLKLLGPVIALGIPSMVGELASGIVILVFNRIMFQLEGNIGIAAYGVIANLSLVVIAIFNGVAQGMQPLVSRAYGRQEDKASRKLLHYAWCTAAGLAIVIYALFWVGAEPIVRVFNSENSEQLRAIAVPGTRTYFAGILFAGINVILAMYFTSIDKAVPAQIISLLRGMLLIVPLAFLLSFLAGTKGVWLAFPVTEASVTGFGFVWMHRKKTSDYEKTGGSNFK